MGILGGGASLIVRGYEIEGVHYISCLKMPRPAYTDATVQWHKTESSACLFKNILNCISKGLHQFNFPSTFYVMA